MERDVRRDAYKVLQVDPEADPEVIQAAYRRLAQKHHPDVSTDPDSPARMAEINAAWELLRDPERRADLDRRRAGVSVAGTAAPQRTRPNGPSSTPAGDPRGSGTPSGGTSGQAEPTAGPPPGEPSGSILTFGRYTAWSLGEIARADLDYLEWLDRMAIGRQYRDEIDTILRRAGRRRSAAAEAQDRHGLYRRR